MKKTFNLCLLLMMLFLVLPLRAQAATKTIEFALDESLKDCTFVISCEDENAASYTYKVIAPNEESYVPERKESGAFEVSVKELPSGTWKVVADNGAAPVDPGLAGEGEQPTDSSADAIGQITVTVVRNNERTDAVSPGNISIAKEISGLKIYFKDDNVVVSWSDTSVGTVNVRVINAKTLRVLGEASVQGNEYEVPLDPVHDKEITVTVKPATLQNQQGVGQSYSKKFENNPDITFQFPKEEYYNQATYTFTETLGEEYTLQYYINNSLRSSEKVPAGEHTSTLLLEEGGNDILVYVVDSDGNMRSFTDHVILDTKAPTLLISKDLNGISTYSTGVQFSGKVEDFSDFTFNNEPVTVNYDGTFTIPAELTIGENKFRILASDLAGNESEYIAIVTRTVDESKPFPWAQVITCGIALIAGVILLIQKRLQRLEEDEELQAARKAKQEELEANNKRRFSKRVGTKGMIDDIVSIAIPVIIAIVATRFIFALTIVQSGSMEPTIMTGDMIIGNGLAFVKRTPERGDIVYVKGDETGGVLYIKRVIGMPGEHLSFIDGSVYVNNKRVVEEYLSEDVVTNCSKEFDIPTDAYFVMGDNRGNSNDSRYWQDPYVEIQDIKGKVLLNFSLPEWLRGTSSGDTEAGYTGESVVIGGDAGDTTEAELTAEEPAQEAAEAPAEQTEDTSSEQDMEAQETAENTDPMEEENPENTEEAAGEAPATEE